MKKPKLLKISFQLCHCHFVEWYKKKYTGDLTGDSSTISSDVSTYHSIDWSEGLISQMVRQATQLDTLITLSTADSSIITLGGSTNDSTRDSSTISLDGTQHTNLSDTQ